LLGQGYMIAKYNTCRRCNETKPASDFYQQSRNVGELEGICKDCKRIVRAARHYNMPENFIEHLYIYKKCMCCGREFTDRKTTHIHHTKKYGVRGIICSGCNYILAEETNKDYERILVCLNYMQCKNSLNRVNPQERLIDMGVNSESSETIRCETLTCKECGRNLSVDKFFPKPTSRSIRKICRDCCNQNWRFRNKYKKLRNRTQHCECCGIKFKNANKACIHHIGNEFRGIICNRCNQVLGDESESRKNQLFACLEFMI
jgi:hypothetical protein